MENQFILCMGIVRHPTGAAVQMEEWIEKRDYYEKMLTDQDGDHNDEDDDEAEQVIIACPSLTIG